MDRKFRASFDSDPDRSARKRIADAERQIIETESILNVLRGKKDEMDKKVWAKQVRDLRTKITFYQDQIKAAKVSLAETMESIQEREEDKMRRSNALRQQNLMRDEED